VTGRWPASTPPWPPATRTGRSVSPGSATSSSAPSITLPARATARRSPPRSSLRSRAVRSPRLARLGRTLRAWRSQLMAYFVTERISNGGTEAINLIIEKTRRLAHGFRNFGNYRLRLLLVADGRRPYPRRAPQPRRNHA